MAEQLVKAISCRIRTVSLGRCPRWRASPGLWGEGGDSGAGQDTPDRASFQHRRPRARVHHVMPIKRIFWDPNRQTPVTGRDIHVLRGGVTRDLTHESLRFVQDDGTPRGVLFFADNYL